MHPLPHHEPHRTAAVRAPTLPLLHGQSPLLPCKQHEWPLTPLLVLLSSLDLLLCCPAVELQQWWLREGEPRGIRYSLAGHVLLAHTSPRYPPTKPSTCVTKAPSSKAPSLDTRRLSKGHSSVQSILSDSVRRYGGDVLCCVLHLRHLLALPTVNIATPRNASLSSPLQTTLFLCCSHTGPALRDVPLGTIPPLPYP